MANMWPLALGQVGWEKKNTSDDNIQRVLLTLTLLISGSGKHACFRGKYCYLGAPIGTPQVPDGWYVAPGLGWGGLRKENASDDNIERVLLIRVQAQTNYFFFTTPHWKMIKVNIFRHYKLLHKLQKWLEHMPNHTLLTRGNSPLVTDCRFGPCC